MSLVCPDCGKPNSDYNLRCQGCGGSLPEGLPATRSTAGPGLTGPLADGPGGPAAAPAIGQSLGTYLLVERLGGGGMGVVYRARCARTGRSAALKTLERVLAAHLPALRREIDALSRLGHPGIVSILDSGTHEGVPWYAMELLEGPTLRQWVHELRPLSAGWLQAILSVVRRLCAALAYLHGEGLVHRDLKPDNVLVLQAVGTSSGPAGRPVLVDFGLSTRYGGALSREALEVTGPGAGTAAYMAPEQVQGDVVDARADLYALGCILYELLAGRPPFLGPNAFAVLGQHLYAQPAAPSQFAPGLPPELDALILRLLAKKARERLGHADDVAAELAGLLRALGAGEDSGPAAPRPHAYLYRPGLVGRDEQLAALVRQLSRLVARAGGLVLVGGESGVGKTRLAVETAREARLQHVVVVPAECLPPAASRAGGDEPAAVGGGPLHPLRRLLQAVADRCREAGKAETDRLLGARGKVLAPYEPALSGLPGQAVEAQDAAPLPAEEARVRLFDALAETLATLAAEKPLLLVLDDLQWADELTLGFLGFLQHSGQLGRMRLLVLGTYRTEEAGGAEAMGPLQALLDCAQVTHLRLDRLGEEAIGALVGDMLALAQPSADLVRSLARHSEGNPFFVAEYLRMAVAEGLLYRDAGAWRVVELTGPMQERYEALPLPGSLRELVGRRLSGLSPTARGLLEAAAVLGRRSDEEVLAQVSQTSGAAGMRAIGELIVRHVLEEIESGRLQFVHDKIREVAYQQIPADRRRELHRAAAAALEAQPAEQRGEHLAALGLHWEEAGERARARSCYLGAARVARDRYALKEAQRLYRDTIRLVEGPTLESVAARNELGSDVLRVLGAVQEALAEHLQALEEAQKLAAPAMQSQALLDLGTIYRETGQIEKAWPLLQQALSLGRELGDASIEAKALRELASASAEQGRLGEARAYYERALAIHGQHEDRRAMGITLVNLANVEADLGHSEQARALYEQAIALLRAIGSRRVEGIAIGNLATLLFDEGHHEQARALYEDAIAIHREVGNRRDEGISMGNLAALLHGAGRLEESCSLAEEALVIARDVGNRRNEGLVLEILARTRVERGQMEEAQSLLGPALAIHREVGNQRAQGSALGFSASLQRRAGRLEEAASLLEQAEQVLRNGGMAFDRSVCLCERGHFELAMGRSARQLLEQAQARSAGLDAMPRSELGRAVSRLRRAVEAFEAGQPLWHGECVEDLPEAFRQQLAAGERPLQE